MAWSIYEKILDDLDDFPGPKTIAWAGVGEPLLHPRLPEMVRAAHEKGMRTEITTNGLLLSHALSDSLLESGLDQLAVSIDGATYEKYEHIRRGSSLKSVIDNVNYFYRTSVKMARTVRIGVVFVAMSENIHELPEVGERAKEMGASFILVTNLLPYREDMVEEILYRVKPNIYESDGSPSFPLWILPNMDLNQATGGPLGAVFRSYSNISFLDLYLNGRSNFCPFVQAGTIAISWQGGVSPCPPLLHSYRCYIRKRPKWVFRCQFGRVGEEKLISTWERENFVAFRHRVRVFDFPPCTDCGGCDLVETNEADCLANPFPVCGDCLWARGILRCP